MSSEVTELILALRDGSTTLNDVAQRFRERSWQRARPFLPQTYLEAAAAAQSDPRPDVSGSFDEVTAAYGRGQLTRQEYRVLAEAAAESIRTEF